MSALQQGPDRIIALCVDQLLKPRLGLLIACKAGQGAAGIVDDARLLWLALQNLQSFPILVKLRIGPGQPVHGLRPMIPALPRIDHFLELGLMIESLPQDCRDALRTPGRFRVSFSVAIPRRLKTHLSQ